MDHVYPTGARRLTPEERAARAAQSEKVQAAAAERSTGVELGEWLHSWNQHGSWTRPPGQAATKSEVS